MKTRSIALMLMLAVTSQACSSALRGPERAGLGGGALDGRTYHVALTSERGGAPASVDLSFTRGSIDASDAREDGFVPAPYTATGSVDFEAETRSPSGVRRFRGHVEGDRVVGTMLVIPHGGVPATYAFAGSSS